MKNQTWKSILDAGSEVADAYRKLVAASDALSDALPYDRDYILRKVMPQKAGERRNGNRITEWLNRSQVFIERDIELWRAEQEEESARAALLEKLKLTDEQKALLGIEL